MLISFSPFSFTEALVNYCFERKEVKIKQIVADMKQVVLII